MIREAATSADHAVTQPAETATPPGEPVTLADAEREHIIAALQETDWIVGGPKGAARAWA